MSDRWANNICTAGSLPFQHNCFNLLRAGHFRADRHPWPNKRSIFWLRRDWRVFFGSVAGNVSPQPAVVPMPMCIPCLFQPVFNSYFIYTAQGPSYFLFNCLVFFPDVFKLLCLENSHGKMQEKSKCGLLHIGYKWSCSPAVGIYLRQVGSLAATTHPALWLLSSLKFGVKSWASSKLTSPLWRWFPHGLAQNN